MCFSTRTREPRVAQAWPQFVVVGTRPDKLWRKAFKAKVHLKVFAEFDAAKLPQRGIKSICQPSRR